MLLDILAFGDGVMIVLSAVLAKILYLDLYLGGNQSTLVYATAGALVAGIAYANMRQRGLYSADRVTRRTASGRIIVTSITAAFLAAMVIAYLFKNIEAFSRAWAILWYVLCLMSVAGWHLTSNRALSKLAAMGSFGRKVAVIGDRRCMDQVLVPLKAETTTHLAMTYALDLERDGGLISDRRGLERFIEIAKTQAVDDIVIAVPFNNEDIIETLKKRFAQLTANIRLFHSDLSQRGCHLGTSTLAGMTLFDVQRAPLSPWSVVAKSAFDRIVSSMALVALAPVMIAIALAIRLESPGPVLFRQRRSGLDHKVITVLKFRSMRVTEDGSTVRQASRHDPRVTHVGRWLRRTSLDELPQLVNVMIGDMSLVGPRPHALAHDAHYSELLEHYANRHRVKPGITGWAQINGYRGATEDPELMRKRVEHDLYYIDHWSFWFDLRIMVLTPFKGLFSDNAY